METLARFTLNAFCSAFATFYLAWLLVSFFRLFLRSPRALYLLLLVPFFKTFASLLFAPHHTWTYLLGESLAAQKENSRSLEAMIAYKGIYPFASIRFHLENGHLFSIGDMLAEAVSLNVMAAISLLLLGGTVFSLSLFAWKMGKSMQWKHALMQKARFWKRPHGLPIYVTEAHLASPLIIGFWKPALLFPRAILDTLTPSEIEAVLAHEKGHALWKDNVMQVFLLCLAFLFWFIPFRKRLLKSIYYFRELGCDRRCERAALLSALYKVETAPPTLSAIAFSSSYGRLKWALKGRVEKKGLKIISYCLCFCGALLIFLSEFLPF